MWWYTEVGCSLTKLSANLYISSCKNLYAFLNGYLYQGCKDNTIIFCCIETYIADEMHHRL